MADQKKPNILVIWGDDIGITNLSCYSDGLMGYRTPNIDRIAKEGMKFTDSYGEQSCTAGRASFITGFMSKAYMIMAAQGLVAQFMATFKDFPPRQKPASFTIEQAHGKMERAMAAHQ